MSKAEIFTKSRREFINVPHMLAHAIELGPDDILVMSIIGGRNIKKSLAVDAFVRALVHEDGVFNVPVSDRMMFEKYPSEADRHLVEGTVSDSRKTFTVGFTRNLWEQEFFLNNTKGPAVLIMPKKNASSLTVGVENDICIHIKDVAPNGEPFMHNWSIEASSDRILERSVVARTLCRLSAIQLKRKTRLPQVALP